MTEHDHAERLMRDLDGVMRGDTPLEDDVLLDTARTLLDADFNAELPLALMRPAALTKGQPKMMSRTHRTLRALLTAAAVFVIAGAAILTVPPLRALAQDILRQIGVINVTDAPAYDSLSQTPMPVIDLVLRSNATSIEVAPEQIELSTAWVATLEELPDGFNQTAYRYVRFPERLIRLAEVEYTNSVDPSKRLSLVQFYTGQLSAGIDYDSAGAQPEDTAVNGMSAVWIDGFEQYPELDVQLLIWREVMGSVFVSLQGSGMSKDEMLAIAERISVRNPEDVGLPKGATTEEIAAAVGFEVAEPQYLPNGIRLSDDGRFVSLREHIQIVTHYTGIGGFILNQVETDNANMIQNGVWDIAVGDALVEDVTVSGNPGVWIGKAPLYGNLTRKYLIWTQNGFTLLMGETSSMSREEMFRIAESITFVPAATTEGVADPGSP